MIMNSPVYRNIKLKADSYELNPVLDPGKNGYLTVTGTDVNGCETVIPNKSVHFMVRTIFTCDDAAVAEITDDGEIIPKHGGLVKISAEYISGGTGCTSDEISVVVRPFYVEYHRTLVYKLFLAMEPHGSLRYESDGKKDSSVELDFEEALDVIRRLDAITNGMPKLVYLVGWQKGGHDHLYPFFNEVNPRLKRECDADARESMRWLMREAKAYNTAVSVHINILDAWEDSPGWDYYHEKHILQETEDGEILTMKGEYFDVLDVHMGLVNYTQLWNSGEFEKRMNELFELLPELYESHSIHLDNWRCEPCPALGITRTDEENMTRKIFAWFRERGFDVTSEGSFHGRTEPMTGLQPMSWWDFPYNLNEMPSSLYSGGRRRTDCDPRFGDTMLVEGAVRENLRRHRDPLAGIQDEYCLYTLPWEFLNHFRLLSFDGKTARYTDGVSAFITDDGIPEIYWNETRIRRGTTMFVPLLFKEDREIVLYSFRDTAIGIKLPSGWEDVESVDLYYLDPLGKCEPEAEKIDVKIKDGYLMMGEETRCAYLIKPHADK